MQLLNFYLPTCHFNERHHIDVQAAPSQVMSAVLAYRPDDDPFFRCAIAIREIPKRLLGTLQRQPPAPSTAFGMDNFTHLQTLNDKEVAYGLAGKLWKADYGQALLRDASGFIEFQEPGSVKLVVGFRCLPITSGLTRLVTETRVHCIDEQARRRFRRYWYVIRPISGLIRRRMLRIIAKRSSTVR